MQFLRQWTGVSKYMVAKPGTFFDHYDEDHGVGYPLAFLFLTMLVAVLPLFLLGAVFNATQPTQLGAVAAISIGFAAYFWVISIVEALIAHVVLYLFGARGLPDTLEAYAFPAIVRYGLWWIPLVNIVLGFYGLYLQIKGLAAFHDVSAGKAAVAGVVALLLYLPVTIAVVAVVGAFLLSLEGGGQPGTDVPAALLAVVP